MFCGDTNLFFPFWEPIAFALPDDVFENVDRIVSEVLKYYYYFILFTPLLIWYLKMVLYKYLVI